MFPTLLEWPVRVHTYGVLIAIAFLVTIYFMSRDAKRAGINPEIISNLAFYGLILGIVGARIAFLFMYPEGFSWSRPLEWIAIWNGGLVFQGAIVPCVLLSIWYLHHHKVNYWQAADAVVPYLALGHGIGRLGCFFSGCCFGETTSLPWGVRFPKGSPVYLDHAHRFADVGSGAAWSHPVHPTQLYGFLGLVALCLLLLFLRKQWNPFLGFTLPLYAMLYGVSRFLVEFLRADNNPTHFGANLSDQQVFSVITFLTGAILFVYLRRLHATRTTDSHPATS